MFLPLKIHLTAMIPILVIVSRARDNTFPALLNGQLLAHFFRYSHTYLIAAHATHVRSCGRARYSVHHF